MEIAKTVVALWVLVLFLLALVGFSIIIQAGIWMLLKEIAAAWRAHRGGA